LAVNWVYQVVRKPSELFFPVSGTLNKTPAETWRQYAPLFQKYSTNVISPELLAALAQVEVPAIRWCALTGAGPSTPGLSSLPPRVERRGDVPDHRRHLCRGEALLHPRSPVAEDGPWDDWKSCWFNRLYMRVIPSHAVELTAAYLDRSVANILERHHLKSATLERKHELAALIHLCGAGAGTPTFGAGCG